MIIDKTLSYWKPEEQERLKKLELKKEKVRQSLSLLDNEESYNTKLDKFNDITEAIFKLTMRVETRYAKARKTKGLLEDIADIVANITKEDYLAFIAYRKKSIAELEILQAKTDIQDDILEHLKGEAREDYDGCYSYFLRNLRVQIRYLVDDAKSLNKARAIIEKRVSLWYVKTTPTFLPIPYGKPTDAIAFLSPKDADIDKIGTATIEQYNVRVRITNYEDLKGSLGIGVDKLIRTTLAIFASNNNFNGREEIDENNINTLIRIPENEYAKLLGYDVEEHEARTEEEAKLEKKRVKTILDNVRKKVKQQMKLAYNYSYDWEESIRGKVESFQSVRLLSSIGYSDGCYYLNVTKEIAKYLIKRNIITQYNTKLLAIDERHGNAYRIMIKLDEQYNMYINQIRGTHNRISIPKVLAVTDLPSYAEVQAKDRGHWERRLKEPLEENLDYLVQIGLLENWEYVHAKGIALTEEEASNILNYEDYERLYLLYEPVDKVDHTEQLEAKRKEIAQSKRKKTASRKS